MAITVVYAGGWDQSFADENSSPGAAIDHGTGSNRWAIAVTGYQGGTHNTPDTFVVSTDTFTAQGSNYNDGADTWRVFLKELAVTGNQTPVLHFTGTYGGGGAAHCAYLILQGTGSLTIANVLAMLGQFAGGGGGDLFRGISGSSGNTLYLLGHTSDTGATAYSGTLVTSSATGKVIVTDTSAGSSNDVGITVGAFGTLYSTGFSVSEAGGGPVITGPSGTPTGPTQATIACSTDTSGVNLYHLILPAATAAPANAAALIADIAAVSHTVSATGAQSYNITGLTTNTAVKVHFAQTGSNVSSSASFTPNTLAIAGTALSAQSGTAGGALTWSGATPESLITNTGNGTPGTAWSILSGAGASGCTVNASTGILVAATLGTADSYTITLQRTDASTVPGAQTVTKTVGLTIGAAPATKIDLTIAAAASLTGIRWSVQSAAALAGSVTTIASGSAESFDGSGNISLDITGLSVPVGAYRYVTLTQSNGDPAQSPAPFGWHGPAIAS